MLYWRQNNVVYVQWQLSDIVNGRVLNRVKEGLMAELCVAEGCFYFPPEMPTILMITTLSEEQAKRIMKWIKKDFVL